MRIISLRRLLRQILLPRLSLKIDQSNKKRTALTEHNNMTMLRIIITASLLLLSPSGTAIMQVLASGDESLISLVREQRILFGEIRGESFSGLLVDRYRAIEKPVQHSYHYLTTTYLFVCVA